MRIAGIRNFFNTKGGAELAFIQMMKALKKRGHDIDIYVLDISQELEEEMKGLNVISLNVKEFRVTNLYPLMKDINALRAMYHYRRLANKINNNYDIAFVDHEDYSPLILPFLKIPKVYYCYEPPRTYYEVPITKILRLHILN